MKRLAMVVVSLLVTVVLPSCSSHILRLAEPEISVRTVEVPRARPINATSFTTVVQVEILNRSSLPLRLQRIELSSVGTGPFNIVLTRRDFNQPIEPSQAMRFPVWSQASYVGLEETLAQSEGQIMVRGVAIFDTEGGGFRTVFLQRVNTSISRPDPKS
jgi:hypothetical protein